eukprot:gene326-428_t
MAKVALPKSAKADSNAPKALRLTRVKRNTCENLKEADVSRPAVNDMSRIVILRLCQW